MCSGSVPSTEGTGSNGQKVGKLAASAGLPLAQPEAVQVAVGPPAVTRDPLQRFPLEVVFLIELFLPVQSLISASAVNRGWALHMSEPHWQKFFEARWSHCYESKCLSVSPSILTRLSGNYNSFWATIEQAFMGDYSIAGDEDTRGSESLFEKLFKLLQPSSDPDSKSHWPWPSITAAPRPAPMVPSWKLACVLRDRSGSVLMGCRLCGQLDVFTPHMRELESTCPTQLRTWVVPCLCPSLVHRSCLEARVRAPPHWPRWISFDTAAPLVELTEGSLGVCDRCGSFYVPGFRLPTVRELIRATWQDRLAWKRAMDCGLMWITGVAIVSLSEALYQGQGDLLSWPKEGGLLLFGWMFQYVVSLKIFFSPRFARVVDLIWLGPIFSFYAKLYLYFLGSTAFMLLTFTPLPLRICPGVLTGYPVWWMVLGWANFCVLFIITSIVIFLFWKTNYRVPSIADRRQSASFEHPILSLGG